MKDLIPSSTQSPSRRNTAFIFRKAFAEKLLSFWVYKKIPSQRTHKISKAAALASWTIMGTPHPQLPQEFIACYRLAAYGKAEYKHSFQIKNPWLNNLELNGVILRKQKSFIMLQNLSCCQSTTMRLLETGETLSSI